MGTEENLGLNSGYIRTEQWVWKRTWDSAGGLHEDSTVGMEENFQTWDSLMDAHPSNEEEFRTQRYRGLSAG